MTCAVILQRAGLVPVVPTLPQSVGTPESKTGRHVPIVPIVPTQKSVGAIELPREPRIIIQFRLTGDAKNAWATCIGAPGITREDAIADLYRRLGDRVEIQPHRDRDRNDASKMVTRAAQNTSEF